MDPLIKRFTSNKKGKNQKRLGSNVENLDKLVKVSFVYVAREIAHYKFIMLANKT